MTNFFFNTSLYFKTITVFVTLCVHMTRCPRDIFSVTMGGMNTKGGNTIEYERMLSMRIEQMLLLLFLLNMNHLFKNQRVKALSHFYSCRPISPITAKINSNLTILKKINL